MSRCFGSAVEECNFLKERGVLTDILMMEIAKHHGVDFNTLKELVELYKC